MNKKVLVAMSGGVDSSTAAAVLLDKGFEPVGITMRLWNVPEEDERRSCCSLDDVNDARRVAEKLGIPHYTLNMKDAFKTNVVDYFVKEYEKGHTPNPCIACNRVLKFELLVQKAKQMDIPLLATGHYARIEEDNGKFFIKRGIDRQKDQSYFLFDIPPKNLPHIIFPIGGINKEETREIARKHGLKTSEKAESQEICFVPGDDYKAFVKDYGVIAEEGDFISSSGEKMGRHSGIPFYTVGQRRGLGIAHGKRLYVTSINYAENTIVVGPENELYCESMVIENATLHRPIADGEELIVQARYRHEGVRAKIYSAPSAKFKVVFAEPLKAVAPGQAAVFYDGETVVGGGWIESFAPLGKE